MNIKMTYFGEHQLVALVATALKLVAILDFLLSVVRLAVATQLAFTELQVLPVEDFMEQEVAKLIFIAVMGPW